MTLHPIELYRDSGTPGTSVLQRGTLMTLVEIYAKEVIQKARQSPSFDREALEKLSFE